MSSTFHMAWQSSKASLGALNHEGHDLSRPIGKNTKNDPENAVSQS